MKRVVALGGQRVEIRDRRLLVDGVPADEPFVGDSPLPNAPGASFGPYDVPAGTVFVLGDNRSFQL